ncbi:MAG: pyruvate dehydrogenase (acetyl-transferring) E1 component subunit alpha [Halobacteriota archaeon]
MSVLERDPVDRFRLLDESGALVEGAEVPPELDDEDLVGMYRHMRFARHFDERAVSLQRQGRMGTYAPLAGQEGAQVGSTFAMDEEDWLFPSYREHIASVVRGVPIEKTLQYWRGDEFGNQVPTDANVFTVAVPIATQIPHATGAAWASRLKGETRAFVVHFGDGATSEGDFHEGLNFAGVFDAPVVFFCNNNQWAISVPRERQTASETIAQKATAYGFEGVQVDGMDPLAVYRVTRDAIEKAKHPGEDERRPTLIEAVQYRFGAHTTADDPTVYRDEEEVERWKELDPISRLETFLVETGRLDQEAIEAIEAEVREEVAEAVDAVEELPEPDPSDIFEYIFAETPPRLREELAELQRLRETFGDETLLED